MDFGNENLRTPEIASLGRASSAAQFAAFTATPFASDFGTLEGLPTNIIPKIRLTRLGSKDLLANAARINLTCSGRFNLVLELSKSSFLRR